MDEKEPVWVRPKPTLVLVFLQVAEKKKRKENERARVWVQTLYLLLSPRLISKHPKVPYGALRDALHQLDLSLYHLVIQTVTSEALPDLVEEECLA